LAIAAEDINARKRDILAIVFFIRAFPALTIPYILAQNGVLNPDSRQKTSKTEAIPYLPHMLKGFEFCIRTVGITVPDGDNWLHEIKYDGYRLRLERDGDRVSLITKGGYDWSKRYPWIVEAALKNRMKQFVIDGEAVILGVDGYSDSTHCTPASTTTKCSSWHSMCWPWTATICGIFRCQCVKPTLRDYLRDGRTASS
jgi:hypothetical protein